MAGPARTGAAELRGAAILVEGLVKVYRGPGGLRAVDGIDLTVGEGELFGLLGPNGAGKTTTVGVCTTRIRPTAGRVAVGGIDVVAQPARAKRSIGVVSQYNTLDRACTVWENLYLHCRYFGMNKRSARARSDELLAMFQLGDRAKASVFALSGGLAQRVQLARALAHYPRVLFLDEPTAGLDPQSRLALWDVVRDLRKTGVTVLLTTHYMEEADALCDRVAVIDHGKILVCDQPDRLKRQLGASVVVHLHLGSAAVEGSVTADLAADLAAEPGVLAVEPTEDGLRVLASAGDGLVPRIVAAAMGVGLTDLSLTEPTLEDVFIKLTGRDLRD